MSAATTPAPPTAGVRPSEEAETIATLISALSEAAVREIHGVLGHQIAAPSSRELRHGRLGLLVELVSHGTGELVGQRAYEVVRGERALAGEVWVSAITVANTFGGWRAATAAAMSIVEGSRGPIFHDKKPLTGSGLRIYTRAECEIALQKCAEWLTATPRKNEYDAWRALSFRAARLTGNEKPRIPPQPRIRELLGTYENALIQAGVSD